MGRDRNYPVSKEQEENTEDLLARVNRLLDYFLATNPDFVVRINSGYRPPAINARTKGAAVNSHHMRCKAIDLADPDGILDDWAMDNLPRLEECGMWMEHPAATKGWAHFQSVAPRSGRRVFYP